MTYTDEDLEDALTKRKGNTAPDWAKNYGIKELWTEVKDGLWVGGTADHDIVLNGRDGYFSVWNGEPNIVEDAEITSEDFQAVVTLYADARPVDWLVEEYRWGIYDSNTVELNPEEIRDVVIWAHKRWKSGKKTLLRCQAGLSRSTFLTALVLVRDGMEINDAIALIQRQRSPRCLTVNGSSRKGQFTRILRDTPVEFWRE